MLCLFLLFSFVVAGIQVAAGNAVSDCNANPIFISRMVPRHTELTDSAGERWLFLGHSVTGRIVLVDVKNGVGVSGDFVLTPSTAIPLPVDSNTAAAAFALLLCAKPFYIEGTKADCSNATVIAAVQQRISIATLACDATWTICTIAFSIAVSSTADALPPFTAASQIVSNADFLVSNSFAVNQQGTDFALVAQTLKISSITEAFDSIASFNLNCNTYPNQLPLDSSALPELSEAIYGSLKNIAIAPDNFTAALQGVLNSNFVRGKNVSTLISALQSPSAMDGVASAFHFPLAIVGGAVRDLLIDGKLPNDIDIATALPYPKLTRTILDAYVRDGIFVTTEIPSVVDAVGRRRNFGMVKVSSLPLAGEKEPLDLGPFKAMSRPANIKLPGGMSSTDRVLEKNSEYLFGFSYVTDAQSRDYSVNAVYADLDVVPPRILDVTGSGITDGNNKWLRLANEKVFSEDLGGQVRFWKMVGKNYTPAPGTNLQRTVCEFLWKTVADPLQARDFLVKLRKKLYDPSQPLSVFQSNTAAYIAAMNAAAAQDDQCQGMALAIKNFFGPQNAMALAAILRQFVAEDSDSQPLYWMVGTWTDQLSTLLPTTAASVRAERSPNQFRAFSRAVEAQRSEAFSVQTFPYELFSDIESKFTVNAAYLNVTACRINTIWSCISSPLQRQDASFAFDDESEDDSDISWMPEGWFAAYTNVQIAAINDNSTTTTAPVAMPSNNISFAHGTLLALQLPLSELSLQVPSTPFSSMQMQILTNAIQGMRSNVAYVTSSTQDSVQQRLQGIYAASVSNNDQIRSFMARIAVLRNASFLTTSEAALIANISRALSDVRFNAAPYPVEAHSIVLLSYIPIHCWSSFGLLPLLPNAAAKPLLTITSGTVTNFSSSAVSEFLDILYTMPVQSPPARDRIGADVLALLDLAEVYSFSNADCPIVSTAPDAGARLSFIAIAVVCVLVVLC